MKTVGSCCMALLVTLLVSPAQTLADLIAYDDFEGEFIDVIKWTPVESPGGLAGEAVREIHGPPGSRRLHMIYRAYGNVGTNEGVVGGRNRLIFPNPGFDPTLFTAIEAKVGVKEFEATGCPGNDEPTQARARISGFFFLLPHPGFGGELRPVLADIRIERRHDSIDPPDVLRVFSLLFLCDDFACFQGTVLDVLPLGTIQKEQSATLFIQWDQATHRWTARRDEQVATRMLPEAVAFGGARRLEISPNVANCSDPPQRVSYTEAFFDDVRVNSPPGP